MIKPAVFFAVGLIILLTLTSCSGNPNLLLVPARPTPTPQSIPADAIVIKNGVVIDGNGAAPIRDGIVVILNDKIVAVGRATDVMPSIGLRPSHRMSQT